MSLTLQMIQDARLCHDGWMRLSTSLVLVPSNATISLGDVLLSNGLDDALWCLRCLPPRDRVASVMPVIKRAATYTTDQRIHQCISNIGAWISGDDTVDLDSTKRMAWSAVSASSAAEAVASAALSTHSAWASWATYAVHLAMQACSMEADVSVGDERTRLRAELLEMFPPMILRESQV